MGGARQTLLTAIVLLIGTGNVWAQQNIAWVNSWAEAQMLAQRHQRLVLIHFWSPDCAPCQKLERSVFNQPELIRALTTNYVPWKVNVAELPSVARDLRVDRWPTDVIMTSTGTEVYRGPSPIDANRYVAVLDQIVAHARLGMPAGVNAGPDVTLPPAQGGPQTASAFPWGPPSPAALQTPAEAQQPASAYPLPAGNPPATTIYGPPSSNPTVSVAGPAPATYRAATPPAATPPAVPSSAQGPLSSAYVTNQWVVPDTTARTAPAEQPASYMATTPADGEFQLPTAPGASVPQATAASQFPLPPSRPPAAPPAASVPPQDAPPTAGVAGAAPRPAAARGPGAATLGPPASVAQLPAAPAKSEPVVGLDGYCPVTLVEQEKWVKGDTKWGANHRGRLYFFISPEAQQRFLENFDKYAPALSGYDAVHYTEHGTLVDGKRAHGVFYRGQIFLFADEAALEQFWTAPERYATTVRAEQHRSAMRSSIQR